LQIDARTVAEAHIYLGSEALAIGLIDAHGSRSEAILDAAELAGVKKYQVVELSDYLGLPAEPSFDVQSLIEDALPGTVFLLDSRIPLAGKTQETLMTDSFYPLWGKSPVLGDSRSDAPLPSNRIGGGR
jgi:hypothetical protein